MTFRPLDTHVPLSAFNYVHLSLKCHSKCVGMSYWSDLNISSQYVYLKQSDQQIHIPVINIFKLVELKFGLQQRNRTIFLRCMFNSQSKILFELSLNVHVPVWTTLVTIIL